MTPARYAGAFEPEDSEQLLEGTLAHDCDRMQEEAQQSVGDNLNAERSLSCTRPSTCLESSYAALNAAVALQVAQLPPQEGCCLMKTSCTPPLLKCGALF